jgi:predicted Zn-dependent protease
MLSSSGRNEQRAKRVNLAITGLMALVSACGSEPVPNANTIRGVYEHHDLKQARLLLDRALKADPDNAELRLLSGQIALETGNLDYAQSEFDQISRDPNWGGAARSLLAKAYFLNDNPRKALAVLGSADPIDGLGFGIKALAIATLGDETQAEGILAAGLVKFPNSPDLVLLSAMTAFASGNQDVALERTQEALRLRPNDVAALTFAVRLALAMQDKAAALNGVNTILRLQPNNRFGLMTKAAIRYDAGDRAGAELLLRQVVKQSGSDVAMPRYFQAQMAFDQGQYKQASALLATVPEPKDFLPAVRLKGVLASYENRNEEAISLLQYYLEQGGKMAWRAMHWRWRWAGLGMSEGRCSICGPWQRPPMPMRQRAP